MIFLLPSKVLTALISPMVPVEIRSSIPMPVFSNLRAIYTTKRRLCSISVPLALESPASMASTSARSSSGFNGGGSGTAEPI